MDISVLNHQEVLNIDDKLNQILEDLIEMTLKEEDLDYEGEVSIMFVDDEEIHELNKTHRDKDSSTDVLSFPQYESLKDEEIIEPYIIFGDVVISTETAIRQAESYGHSLMREIGFLVVHSMFHLFGYDHDTEEHTKEMRAKEESVLSAYNLTR